MTEAQFQNKIEGVFNDFSEGVLTKEESITAFIETFLEVLKPVEKAKKHLNLFLYRVMSMRDLQKEFFAGKKSVKFKSMEAEYRVDKAMTTLISELGYSVEEFKIKNEQPKLL